MKSTIISMIVICGVVYTVGHFSASVLITTVLMAAGVLVAAMVRALVKHDPFSWPAVFHKGCATVHWAFISFYVFSFDRVRSDLSYRPIHIFILILIASFVLYVFGGLNTRKVLDAQNPSFHKTKDERVSILLAMVSLAIAVVFARFLIH